MNSQKYEMFSNFLVSEYIKGSGTQNVVCRDGQRFDDSIQAAINGERFATTVINLVINL
jgi:hypothetical protein